MTREEAINEINKVFEPAFANYIITALIEGATVSDKEPTTKNDLGVDAVSRQAINIYIDFILNHGMGKKKSFDFIKKFVTNLPSVTPQEPFINKPCVSEKVCEHDKQMVLLDKIRAEIIEEMLSHSGTGEETIQAYADGLKKGLDILDKYKAESEVEDGNDIHIR